MYFTDEKKLYDPVGFRDAILEGLEVSWNHISYRFFEDLLSFVIQVKEIYLLFLKAAGDDLEAVSKFLDSAGGKQDYRRYGVSLIEILVAGGLLGMCISHIARKFPKYNFINTGTGREI